MKHLLTLIFLFTLVWNGIAQDFPAPMQPKRIVNDFTNLFDGSQQTALETKLRHFNDTSSTQIAVVTVPSLQGYAPNDYAQRLAEQWKIGQKGKDNGILILIKPKTGREKGQIAIAVGYGLEGAVPDALTSRIIRNKIIPQFQKGHYYEGVNQAVDALIKLSSGEYKADQEEGDSDILWGIIPFIILFIVVIVAVNRHGGKNSGGNYTSGTSGGPFILWGGSGNFGRSSGGSSFGGFGGFGGGSFGGGGASGSW